MQLSFRNTFVTLAYALLLGLSTHSALAADITCGHDDDESGAYGTACYTTAKDKDHDGYTTDGSAGQNGSTDVDCDDTNWKIGTDAWVDAGGGTVKRCKSDGTYTTAVAVSALVASDISSTSTTLVFLQDGGSTSGGCGAYAAPCDHRCLVDSGRACYVAPSTTNDAFWFLPGTYNDVATAAPDSQAVMFYLNNKDGSALDPIRFIADPRAAVIFDTPGTSGSPVRAWRFDDSDYIYAYGFDLGHGYSTTGVTYNSGSNNKFLYGRIEDVDGNAGTDNLSGITFNGGSNNEVRATLFKNNYGRAAPTNENSVTGVVVFSGTGNTVLFSSVVNTSQEAYGLIKFKHGAALSPGYAIGNHLSNFYRVGIAFDTGGFVGKNNYIKGKASNSYAVCFDQHNWGGTPYYDQESVISYNTCIDGALMYSKPEDSASALASPYYLTVEYNAAIDSATQYNYEDSGSPFHEPYSFAHYADATMYAAMLGKFRVRNNCIYNSSTGGFKGTFAGNLDASRKYGTWAAWTAAGYDAGSSNSTCNCGTDGYCTGASTTGMFGDGGGGGTTTTTTTTVTTTTSSTSTSSTSTTVSTTSVSPTTTVPYKVPWWRWRGRR